MEEVQDAKHYDYSIIALPENFVTSAKLLNNYGQVTGYLDLGISYVNGRAKHITTAALWDVKKGVIPLKLIGQSTKATNLNDYGCMAIVYDENCFGTDSRALLWDSNINEIKFGPSGIPFAINNCDTILVRGKSEIIKWDPKNNTVVEYKAIHNCNGISNFGELITNDSIKNSQGSYLSKLGNSDLTLFYNGASHLLLPLKGTLINPLNAYLNDRDNVIAMTKIQYGEKSYHAITKWSKCGSPTRSKALEKRPELSGYDSFGIVGFNDSGQVLISAWGSKTAKSRFFILIPLDQ